MRVPVDTSEEDGDETCLVLPSMRSTKNNHITMWS